MRCWIWCRGEREGSMSRTNRAAPHGSPRPLPGRAGGNLHTLGHTRQCTHTGAPSCLFTPFLPLLCSSEALSSGPGSARPAGHEAGLSPAACCRRRSRCGAWITPVCTRYTHEGFLRRYTTVQDRDAPFFSPPTKRKATWHAVRWVGAWSPLEIP